MGSLTIKRTLTLTALLAAGFAPALVPVASHALSSHAAGSTIEPGKPEVSTGGDRVNGLSEELDGTVNPRKLATSYYFEYGPTNAYGSKTTPANLPGEPAEPINVAQTVTGMQAGWRYRIVASNSDGTSEGKEHIFTVKVSKKTSKTGINLPQPTEATPVGSALVLSGTVTGIGDAGREVVLQATPYPYTATFADVGAPLTTNIAGGFSFPVPDLTTSTRFRVSTIGAPPLLTSRVISVLAAVHVTLKVKTSKRTPGLVRLYGTVSPAQVGARVYFQLEKAPKEKVPTGKVEKPRKSEKPEKDERPSTFSNKFATIAKRATKSFSRFSLIVNIREAGLYRAFVAVTSGPLASGHSQTVPLRAGASKRTRR
jgi:hypothetical protein